MKKEFNKNKKQRPPKNLLEEVDVLDEMTSYDDIRVFTCMNGLMPPDVVLIEKPH